MYVKKISLLVVFFLFSIFYSQQVFASQKFTDVTSSNSAFNEINYLVEQGIISGYTEGNKKVFKPNNNVTRGQAIKMVVLAAGYKSTSNGRSSFNDVDAVKSAELSGYVETAIQQGIITVPANKMLYPMQEITRDEMSKMLALAFKLNVEQYASLQLPFEDISKEHTYYKYIAAIYYNGITKGNTTGTLYNATEPVKRSQFSSFVARALSDTYRLELPVQGITVPDEKAAIKKVYVTTDGLNVRSTPLSVNSTNILGKLNTNEVVYVYKEQDGWLQVGYKGQFAFVAKQYTQDTEVTIPTPVVEETPTVVPAPNTTNGSTSPQIGYATVNDLAMRAEPNSSAKVITRIKRDTVVDVLAVDGYWTKVAYNGQTGYIHKTYLRIKNQQGPVVAGRIIVLDPGHGGKDPGAKFVFADKSEVYEKDMVLKVGLLVRKKLEQDGAIVKMTRSDDTFIELADRVKFTKNNYADMFISIHVNAASSSNASGTETFYSKSANENEKEDLALATFINNEIVKNAQMKDRGIKRENYTVISGVVMPAVLLELGFISNEGDRTKLLDERYIEIYAQSIYNGIVQYYSK